MSSSRRDMISTTPLTIDIIFFIVEVATVCVTCKLMCFQILYAPQADSFLISELCN